MTIFFTGCTHFDHARIIELCDRPFADVEEMNEAMIKNWNQTAGPKDTVYHLGDFGYINHRERANYLLSRLNGRKILLYGNHDETPVSLAEGWFSSMMYYELKHEKRNFVLFHYPIEDWNGRYKGSIHLHCHTHAKEFRDANGQFRFNVGVDACGFAPVSIDRILAEASV